MAIFTGAGVAIVTPFNDDEERSINYDKLDALLDYHCNNGTDCIVICGTTGESATMTEEEHMQCVKFAIDRVKGRIPVIAGTGSNCTRTAIDMSKEAADYGADGLLLVTPYYNKATQAGLIAHYEAVAKEAKKQGLTTMLVTNGTKLNEDFLSANQGYLDWIILSVDSLDDNANLVSGRAIAGKRTLSVKDYKNTIFWV